MPPKRFYSTKTRKSAATGIRRWRMRAVAHKYKKKTGPRYRIQQNPLFKPTCYNFTRAYDYAVKVGVADEDNLVYMNTDNKYMIIKLHGIMSNLPDFDDFRTLFNQFQLVSITHTLTPNYKNNIGQVATYDSNDNILFTQAVPNYQVYFIPENYTIDKPDLQTLTSTEIDEFINKSQRKAVALIPGKQMNITNSRPSIPGDVIAQAKGQGFVSSDMERAGYLDNDLQDTIHYGFQLVIRKVSGDAISNHNPSSTISTSPMGWRINNQLYFRMRKVQ
jgi:hypothetical protein